MAVLNLPEPLQTAAHSAGQMIAMGTQGTATKGCATEDFAELCNANADDLFPFLRQTVEVTSRRMTGSRSTTLRQADKDLFDRRLHDAVLFLAKCPADTAEGVVTARTAATTFYAIRAASEEGVGLIVIRC